MIEARAILFSFFSFGHRKRYLILLFFFFLFLGSTILKTYFQKELLVHEKSVQQLHKKMSYKTVSELQDLLKQYQAEYQKEYQFLHQQRSYHSSSQQLSALFQSAQEEWNLSELSLSPPSLERDDCSKLLLPLKLAPYQSTYHFLLPEQNLFPLLEKIAKLQPALAIINCSISNPALPLQNILSEQEKRALFPFHPLEISLELASIQLPSLERLLATELPPDFPPSLLRLTSNPYQEERASHHSQFSKLTGLPKPYNHSKLARLFNLRKKAQQDFKILSNDIEQKDGAPLFSGESYYFQDGKLHNLLEEPPLYPPIPNHWIITHHLDFTDPQLLERDPDHDGFNNLEEWLGSDPIHHPGMISTDPNALASHPPLWSKLHLSKKDLIPKEYLFEFTGYDTINNDKEKKFILQPITPLPRKSKLGNSIIDTQRLHLRLGDRLGPLPLFLVGYQPAKEKIDEILYDSSQLFFRENKSHQIISITHLSRHHSKPKKITLFESVRLHIDSYLSSSDEKNILLHLGESFWMTPDHFLKDTLCQSANPQEGESIIKKYTLTQIKTEGIELSDENGSYLLPLEGQSHQADGQSNDDIHQNAEQINNDHQN